MKGTPTPKKGPSARVGSETKERGRAKSRSKSRAGYQTPQKEKLELSTIAVEIKPDPKPKVATDTPLSNIKNLCSAKPKATDDTSSVMPNQTENRTEEQSAELPTISDPKPEVMKGTPTPKKGPSARVGSETKERGRAKSRSKSRAGYQTPQKEKLELSTIAVEIKTDPIIDITPESPSKSNDKRGTYIAELFNKSDSKPNVIKGTPTPRKRPRPTSISKSRTREARKEESVDSTAAEVKKTDSESDVTRDTSSSDASKEVKPQSKDVEINENFTIDTVALSVIPTKVEGSPTLDKGASVKAGTVKKETKKKHRSRCRNKTKTTVTPETKPDPKSVDVGVPVSANGSKNETSPASPKRNRSQSTKNKRKRKRLRKKTALSQVKGPTSSTVMVVTHPDPEPAIMPDDDLPVKVGKWKNLPRRITRAITEKENPTETVSPGMENIHTAGYHKFVDDLSENLLKNNVRLQSNPNGGAKGTGKEQPLQLTNVETSTGVIVGSKTKNQIEVFSTENIMSDTNGRRSKKRNSSPHAKMTMADKPSRRRKTRRMRKTQPNHEDSVSVELNTSSEIETNEHDSLTSLPSKLKTTIHRLRHTQHIPRGILRLASTPYSIGVTASPYLAISRDGGSVELVSVNEKWKCVSEVEGIRNRNVDAMAWVCTSSSAEVEDALYDANMTNTETKTAIPNIVHFCPEHQKAEEIHSNRRLIGGSRDGTIFEVDFKTKKHTSVIGSGGGGVFCLTSLDPCISTDDTEQTSSSCGLIAAGCEDGSVRIFNATSSGLELVCALPTVGSPILSIAWRSGIGGGSHMAGSTLYAGAADGTIRKFECDTPLLPSSGANSDSVGAVMTIHHRWKAVTRMTVENRGRQTPTKVWALKALADGTVVSGDSMGSIQFWDGRSGTLLQSFEHNAEKADVLDLAVNFNQSKVMACGIDSKVVYIERNDIAEGMKKWVMTAKRRMHTNDVNSLAVVYMSDTKGTAGYESENQEAGELFCSGGLDTRVFSYSADNITQERPKLVFKYPPPHLRLAKHARILSVMRCDKVDFFQLEKKIDVDACSSRVTLEEDQALLGSIIISGIHNLVCMDITDDGKFLAVSDASCLYMFSLESVESKGASKAVIVPTMINLPISASAPCSSLRFVQDASYRLICASTTGVVNVLKIEEGEEINLGPSHLDHKVTVEHTFNELTSNSRTASYNFPISTIVISPDCSLVAVCRNTMSTGSINVLSIMPDYKHWYSLPCLDAPHSCVSFLGNRTTKPKLVVGCNNGSFYVIDVEQKCISDWNNDLGIPVSEQLPKELTGTPDCPVRLAFNPSFPNKFLMGGQNWFCAVDLDSPMPKTSQYYPRDHINAPKSRPDSNPNPNLTICVLYSGIIFMDFLSEDELVIAEQPWLDILNSLPDALERKRYGS